MRLRGASGGAGPSLLAAFLFSACLPYGALSQQVPGGQTEFTSVAGGYVVYYPSEWRVVRGLPTLDIYNFPFSQAGGGVLPDGGASIALVPALARFATVEDWIKADSLLSEQQSRNGITLPRPGSREALQVTEVRSRISEGMASVDCYFEIPGHLLVGRLIYWPNDPKAEEYREVLHKVIEGVRPLAR